LQPWSVGHLTGPRRTDGLEPIARQSGKPPPYVVDYVVDQFFDGRTDNVHDNVPNRAADAIDAKTPRIFPNDWGHLVICALARHQIALIVIAALESSEGAISSEADSSIRVCDPGKRIKTKVVERVTAGWLSLRAWHSCKTSRIKENRGCITDISVQV
jgi:hypothetical protein